jgi:hypothetical protein
MSHRPRSSVLDVTSRTLRRAVARPPGRLQGWLRDVMGKMSARPSHGNVLRQADRPRHTAHAANRPSHAPRHMPQTGAATHPGPADTTAITGTATG